MAVAVTMAILSVTAPFVTIIPAYQKHTQPVLAVSVPATAIPIDLDFEGRLRLIGYEVNPIRAQAGQETRVDFYWQVTQAAGPDLGVYLHFQHRSGHRVSFRGSGYYVTSVFTPGEVFRATHYTQIPAGSEPLLLQVRVGLYDTVTGQRLPITDARGKKLGDSVEAARLKIDPASKPVMGFPVPPGPSPIPFGNQVALAYWEINTEQARPGGAITGTLYWQALKPFEKDLTVFVQMLGAQGIVAQSDLPPQAGEFPTLLWRTGEVVPDTFKIDLPPKLAPGSYLLIVGMYNPGTMQRLPAQHGDHLRMVEVTVYPP